jgi:hypothetical protein
MFVGLNVHPSVIVRILRHADRVVTKDTYPNANLAATRDALRRLGDISFEHIRDLALEIVPGSRARNQLRHGWAEIEGDPSYANNPVRCYRRDTPMSLQKNAKNHERSQS